jgi:uncharacterized membrane protein YkoI
MLPSRSLFVLVTARIVGALLLAMTQAPAASAQPTTTSKEDWRQIVKRPAFDLRAAIQRGFKEGGKGELLCAELEKEEHYGGRLVYSLDIIQGAKTRNVLIDAVSGEIIENELDPEEPDHSAMAKACATGPSEAIDAAVKKCNGTPIYARLFMRNGKAGFAVMIVDADKLNTVVVDGSSGEASVSESKPLPKSELPSSDHQKLELDKREFTEVFNEDKADLGPTGRNRYFILEPGNYWIFESQNQNGPRARVTYTILQETRKIDDVEVRPMESREELDGKLVELTLDYFAISRKTGNVYYFGEDVDIYKDGKVVSHEGAWMSGKDGARYGLMVPAVPLLGDRHYQEIAPGIARDRVEVLSLNEVVETPAGKFTEVMKQEETNPEEPGHVDYKYYAPGVGMVKEEGTMLLVKYGKK